MKVLLIENDRKHAEQVENRLRKFNPTFKVDTVRAGEASVDTLLKKKYEAVVLDQQLPSRDAAQLVAQLKKSGHDAPIVVLAGNANGSVSIKTVNNGAADVVVNGNDYLALLPEVVQKSIEQHRLESKFQTLILNSKRKLQNTFDGITDIIFQINQKHEITMANRSFANLCQTQPDKLIGRKYHEVFCRCD
ncbi:MAG TPA: response regulator, partial [bacterium]